MPSENKPTKLTLWKRVKEYSLANAVPLSLILAIVGTVIGLGGFAFGVWSHFASQHNPLLKYLRFAVYSCGGNLSRGFARIPESLPPSTTSAIRYPAASGVVPALFPFVPRR